MRRVILTALMICLFAAAPAWSGAWLRETGTGFSAVSAKLRQRDQGYEYETSAYAEYGVSANLTFGLDLNQTPGLSGHVLMFARLPIVVSSGQDRFAIELGLGAQQYLGLWSPMQKLTLSYGRPTQGRFGPGWVNVDLAAEFRRETPDTIYKLDATLGLAGPQTVRPLVQIETLKSRQTPLYWSVTPSILIKRPDNRSLLLGFEYRAAQSRTAGLKFALWRSF